MVAVTKKIFKKFIHNVNSDRSKTAKIKKGDITHHIIA